MHAFRSRGWVFEGVNSRNVWKKSELFLSDLSKPLKLLIFLFSLNLDSMKTDSWNFCPLPPSLAGATASKPWAIYVQRANYLSWKTFRFPLYHYTVNVPLLKNFCNISGTHSFQFGNLLTPLPVGKGGSILIRITLWK